ncbi:DUF5617 domain-containing protein [Legionella dresdenensis]|uniref:DUF5617 domain-containing protein n=1 Tax=Legionella dresdenensis TaxID=450200 RepID=A0ABV8CGN9_9GAMM
MSIISQIKQAVDIQDVDVLKRLLNENQDLDLNHITPNKLSILWWALHPPAGKQPAREIIYCLLNTGKIDPFQEYADTFATWYVADKTRFREMPANWLFQVLCVYENNYQQQHVIENEGALERFANDGQNTHDSFVVRAVDSSIVALYQRYQRLAMPVQSLDSFLSQLKPDNHLSGQEIKAAKIACSRIKTQPENRQYAVSETEKTFLTNQQVLNLLWQAVNDANPQAFVAGIDMSPTEVLMRKYQLVKHLAMAQNEYGTNHAACWMGTRNQIVSSLDAIHIDVKIAQEVAVTEKWIGYQYIAYSKKRLEELAQTQPKLFRDYLRFYHLRGLPGGCRQDEKTPEDLQHWVVAAHDQFESEIRGYYQSVKPEQRQITSEKFDSLLALLRDPYSLSETGGLESQLIAGLKKLENILTNLFESNVSLGTNLFGSSKADLQIKVEQIITHYCSGMLTQSTDFIQTMTTEVIDCMPQAITSATLKERLLTGESGALWKSLFERLTPEQTEQRLNHLKVKCIQLISENKNLTHPRYFWLTLADMLIEKFGQDSALAKWFNTLPKSTRQNFSQQILNKYGYSLTEVSEHALIEDAFIFGLEEGYINHLECNQLIIIKDKDLRGFDLSTVDLTHIEFINCDLRLTGIFANPGIKASHIEHNQLDSRFFSNAVKARNVNAVRFAALSPKAENFFGEYEYHEYVLERLIFSGLSSNARLGLPVRDSDLPVIEMIKCIITSPYFTQRHFQDSSTLFRAVESGIMELVRLALDSRHCKAESFFIYKNDYGQRSLNNTTLHAAIARGVGQRNPQILQALLQSPLMTSEVLRVKNGLRDALVSALVSSYPALAYPIMGSKYCTEQMIREALPATQIYSYSTPYGPKILNKYFNLPRAYQDCYQRCEGSELDKACALLVDYTKGDSRILRFFTGHWNRHHIEDVNRILAMVKRKQIVNVDQLLEKLYQIDFFNHPGSLASRTLFIAKEYKKLLLNPEAVQAPDALQSNQGLTMLGS